MIQSDITILFWIWELIICELFPILEFGPMQTLSRIQFSPIIVGPIICESPKIFVPLPIKTSYFHGEKSDSVSLTGIVLIGREQKF